MIVCDGPVAKGCPAGAVLDVELVTREGQAAIEAASELITPHGWGMAPREGQPAAADPLCPTCIRRAP